MRMPLAAKHYEPAVRAATRTASEGLRITGRSEVPERQPVGAPHVHPVVVSSSPDSAGLRHRGDRHGAKIGLLKELHALKIDLYLHQQGLDTTTPAGEAMFGMLGIFAQFERAIIQERVRAGLARARKEGKTLGRPQIGAAAARARQEGRRPPKRLDTPEGRAKDRAELERQIRARRATGAGILKIARELGVGTGTVQRVVNGA